MSHTLSRASLVGAAALLLSSCGGASAGSTGPDQNSPACTKPALTIGGTATGNTGSNICSDGKGQSGNFYTLTVTQTTPVTIALTGNAFPGFLGLFYDNGQAIAQRNPSTLPLRISVVLGPGTYTVIVGSMTSADGPYTVSTSPLTLDTCVNGLLATEGAVVTGTVTTSACFDDGGNRTQVVTWAARAAKTLAFTVTLDRKAVVLVNGGGATINQTGGPGNVTASMSTQLLVAYHLAGVYVTHLPSLSALPITYTIRAE